MMAVFSFLALSVLFPPGLLPTIKAVVSVVAVPGAFGRHHQGAADPLWRNRALCRELLSGKKVIKSQAGDFGLFVFQTPVSLCFLLRLQARC